MLFSIWRKRRQSNAREVVDFDLSKSEIVERLEAYKRLAIENYCSRQEFLDLRDDVRRIKERLYEKCR